MRRKIIGSDLKSYKTPLRYPGGKTRAIKILDPWIPEYDVEEFREPFLGGGSMSIHLSKKYPSTKIWVNDAYESLYNFWNQLKLKGEAIQTNVSSMKVKMDKLSVDSRKEMFKELKKELNTNTTSPLDKAVIFYILNKCSFAGLTENSTFSPTAYEKNFAFTNISKIEGYSEIIQNWKITNLDYSELMNAQGNNVFIFLDPPYDIDSFLYGKDQEMHSGFSHERFCEEVHECQHRFMITYNAHKNFEELYKKFNIHHWEFTYAMQHRKDNVKTELLVTNYNIHNHSSPSLEEFICC